MIFMKLLNKETMNALNGGKTVRCPDCGHKVWINPFYAAIRFWWSKSTWETDVAASHWYHGNYRTNVH